MEASCANVRVRRGVRQPGVRVSVKCARCAQDAVSVRMNPRLVLG